MAYFPAIIALITQLAAQAGRWIAGEWPRLPRIDGVDGRNARL